MSNDHGYDLTTTAGLFRRDSDMTRRRIPPRFRDATASDPAVAAWCDALILAYQAGSVSDVKPLLITGPTGSGKTWQAYGAIRRVTAGIVTGWLASNTPDLYALLRPGDGGGESEYRRWAAVPLLLLDDLGAAKGTEWTEEITYRLVTHRSEHVLPTIFTTNLPVRAPAGQPSLQRLMGERVFSRLAECTLVTLKGRDRRLGAS